MTSSDAGRPVTAGATADHRTTVLVYSDDVDTREQVRLAVGRRPAAGLPRVEWIECATAAGRDRRRWTPAGSTSRSSTARPHPPAGWASAGSSRTRSTSARRCWCSPAGRRTTGWPPGRGRTPSCRTRWTRSRVAEAVAALMRQRLRAAARRCVRDRRPRPGRRPSAHLARPARRAARAARTSTAADTAWAMDQVMTGEATPAQIAGVRGGAAGQGRDRRRGHRPGRGDAATTPRRSRSPARSSTSSAPAATARTPSTSPRWPRWWSPAPGARVVKHGNRAASSSCGSADVLEELGVRLDLAPAAGRGAAPSEAGITFCFAPGFHPAMRHAAVPAARARRRHRRSTSSGR